MSFLNINQVKKRSVLLVAIVCGVFFGGEQAIAQATKLSEALRAVTAVGENGIGNEAAAKAMQVINAAPSSELPTILAAMENSNRISANWIRSGVNSIVARDPNIPRAKIESYFKEQSNDAMGRLLAFELLTDGNEELANRMIPKLLDDPSMPLRQKAIAALITDAENFAQTDQVKAMGSLGVAFNKARDVKQLESIAQKLSDLGVEVNLQRQLGFLNQWQVVGSFDNKDMRGFDVAYGPEEAIGMIDTAATYQDLEGKEAEWGMVTTAHKTGVVDLNDRIGKVKGATVYALGSFVADDEVEAEIRIGTPNATKIWVNGEMVMSNEIYHNSNAIDKFIGKVKLKKGDNQILVKVCQNEQQESWAQDWQFQLRICDSSGKAIASAKPRSQQ